MAGLLFVAERGAERFEIIEDLPEVGFYVFRYLNGQNTHDYLQDNLPTACLCAENEWGVKPTDWHAAGSGELPLYAGRGRKEAG